MGIKKIDASIDLFDEQVTVLELRRNYPDDITEEYWDQLINVADNDVLEPVLNNLRGNYARIDDNIKEIFGERLKKIIKKLQEANDDDGAQLADFQIQQFEGSLSMGLNFLMKTL